MGITRTPSVPNLNADAFVVEFLNAAGYLVAVSPLYVVGVEESVNGVAIRTARGSVADQFFVAGPARDVLDRLRECWHKAQDSFLANFMRADMGAMEDRLMQRVQQQCTNANGAPVNTEAVAAIVRSEIEAMAAGEMPKANKKPKPG